MTPLVDALERDDADESVFATTMAQPCMETLQNLLMNSHHILRLIGGSKSHAPIDPTRSTPDHPTSATLNVDMLPFQATFSSIAKSTSRKALEVFGEVAVPFDMLLNEVKPRSHIGEHVPVPGRAELSLGSILGDAPW